MYVAEIVANLTRLEIDYSCPEAKTDDGVVDTVAPSVMETEEPLPISGLITVTDVQKGPRTALVYADYEGAEVLIGTLTISLTQTMMSTVSITSKSVM